VAPRVRRGGHRSLRSGFRWGRGDREDSNRISHVNQNYTGTETYIPANLPLIAGQAEIALAQPWGDDLVAGIDGMRFVVPVPSIYARPNRKYFETNPGRDVAEHAQRPGLGAA
jgi:TnpA family transposase